MNKHFAWAALGALGLLVGCGDGGTTSTSGGGGSMSTATGTGGNAATSTATATATGTGGGTATSSAASTGSGSTGEICSACVGMKEVFKAGSMCAMKLADCNADVDCDSWFKCVQNCQMSNFTTECFAACDQSASVVANLYQPVYDCTCGACKTECGAACP